MMLSAFDEVTPRDALTLSREDLRSIVGPVLPWVGTDLTMPTFTLVRLLAWDGFMYATATNGRSAAIARTRLDHAPARMKVPAEGLVALLDDESVVRVELEDHGRRIGVSLTHDDTTLSLDELLTYPDAFVHGVGVPLSRVLEATTRTSPGIVARDMGRLAASLQHYGLGHEVACDIYPDDQARGYLVAAHSDRFIALIPNADGSRTGSSEKVRHVGATSGRGSTFVAPLDVWPGLLQEVPL